MELEEIRPEMGEFTLLETGEIVHRLRKFGIDDHVWMKQTLKVSMEEVMRLPWVEQAGHIVRVAFHLLIDKSPFHAKVFPSYDEMGNKIDERIGGAQLLGRWICGPIEYGGVLSAVVKTMNASQPKPVEISEEDKKKEVTLNP